MTDELVYHVLKHVIPASYDLLPGRMASDRATAMLLAIGLQESRFQHRQQVQGPARGFWQFETGGVKAVLTNSQTGPILLPVLKTLVYPEDTRTLQAAVAHNDVLACVFARLLLWAVPGALPDADQPSRAWEQYLKGWQPGKPHPQTWNLNFLNAWKLVLSE